MALAVELYFDERTEESIEALRDEVNAAGIEPAPELAGARPHVSLAVVETEDVDSLSEVVAGFTAVTPTCAVRLGAIASFATRQGVLYLAPVPTIGLLELHSRFHAMLVDAGLESRPLYLPGSWIPHCTLEMGLSGNELAEAFDICWRHFSPFEGRLVAAGVVSFPPPRPNFISPLRGGDSPE